MSSVGVEEGSTYVAIADLDSALVKLEVRDVARSTGSEGGRALGHAPGDFGAARGRARLFDVNVGHELVMGRACWPDVERVVYTSARGGVPAGTAYRKETQLFTARSSAPCLNSVHEAERLRCAWRARSSLCA